MRVLHASPDAPSVDVYLDGAKVDALVNVPFASISDYLMILAGDHKVEVYPTGTSDTAVIAADVTVTRVPPTPSRRHPVATIKAAVFVDDAMPRAGAVRLRVVHLSADAPSVDVAPDGADPVVSDLAYPKATDYLDLDGGSYDHGGSSGRK